MKALRSLYLQPFLDTYRALETTLSVQSLTPVLLKLVTALVLIWFVYVPIHELLHVAGCAVTGGSVSELEIAPQYGGALLARVFPFVVSGGEYAGRLSGFDWKDNDLIYLATDIAPFLLTIFIGVALLRASKLRARPVCFAAGLVVGLAPFISLIGDYYEMGSILVTRIAATLGGDREALFALRSDDVFKLVEQIVSPPEGEAAAVKLARNPALGVVALAQLVGLHLALVTYALGRRFARHLPLATEG